MAESTMWWVLAGVAIAVELVSGTFYLLMLAIGMMAAAIAAVSGATLSMQLVVAAVIGAGSVLVWHRYKQRTTAVLPASKNSDVNLDVNETVHVETWDVEGTTSVKYRGAIWQAISIANSTPAPGIHRIVEVVGSQLVLKKI